MLRHASSIFGSKDAEDREAKEARERQRRAERLQQRRSQTVQGAARLLPRSPQSTSFSIFDNAPPMASNATEFDKEFETKGKGRRQMNPMGEAKQREAIAEDDKLDKLADARGINRAQAKVLLAQNPGLKVNAKPVQEARYNLAASRSKSSTSTVTSASTQSQARQQVYAPQPRYAPKASTRHTNVASPGPQAISPQFATDTQSPPPRPQQTVSKSPLSSHRGSPAQQLVRSASDESIPVSPQHRIVSIASPTLPALDFSSPRSAPSPPSLLRNQMSPTLSAFGLPRIAGASASDMTAGNYSFSSSEIPNNQYGFGDSLPQAQITTVGGLRGEQVPQAYSESMIYDAIARAR